MPRRAWRSAVGEPRRGALARWTGLATLALCATLASVAGCGEPSDPKADSSSAAKPADRGGLRILNPQNPDLDYNFNLGRLAFGQSREFVVELANDSGRTLHVSRITPSCSCTTAAIAYTTPDGQRVDGPRAWDDRGFDVPADARLALTLRVDSRLVPAKNAAKLVRLVIESDSSVDPFKVIEAHVVVDMPFYVIPQVLDLGQVPIGGIAHGHVDITPAMGGGERIVDVLSKPDGFEVALEGPQQLGGDRWRLNVRWFPPLDRGSAQRSVVLSTTGAGGQGEGPPLEIRVQAMGVDDVIAEPMAFDVPARVDAGGGAGAVTLRSLVKGTRIQIGAMRLDGPHADHFRLTATPVAPDELGRSEQWTVQLLCVTPVAGSGAFAGVATLELINASAPDLRIPYLRKGSEQ